MTINVSGPDGVSVSFPDGTDAAVINDVMTKHFGGGAAAAPKASPITTGDVVSSALDLPVVGPLARKADAAIRAAAAPVTNPTGLIEQRPEPTFGERYSHALESLEAPLKKFETEHPVASAVSNIAGTTAATLPLAATSAGARLLGIGGRTLPAQIAQGAASGAGINAVDAALRGNDPGTAALVGGGIGAVAPPVARLAGAAVAPVVDVARGILNPGEEAARRVSGAIGRDVAAGGQGLTEPEFRTAAAQGAPVNLMDAGGETTRALARSAANTSPEGRQVLDKAIDDRFQSQSDRLSDWFNSTFNYPNAALRQQALERSQSITDNHNYARAMQEGDRSIWSPDLERLASSPDVMEAMRKATRAVGNEAVIGGYAGMNPKFSFTPDGRIQPGRGPTGNPIYPNLQFWDMTRRQLSDMANQAGARQQDTAFRQLSLLSQQMNRTLDKEVPSYAAARAGHEAFENAQDALQAGKNYATAGRIDNQAAQTAIMRMDTTQRKLFQDGFVDALVQRIRAMPDRQNVAAKIANSRAAQEQMEIALGPQRAREVQAMLHLENVMDKARGAVQGNSTTARQLAELGLAGGAGGLLGGGNPLTDPQSFMNAALIYGAMKGGKMGLGVVDQRVSTQVAKLLASGDLAKVRLGMNLIGKNPGLLGSLRNFDTALARAMAAQTNRQSQ